MTTPLRVLVVDADEESALKMRAQITEMVGAVDVEHVAGFEAGLQRMVSGRYDAHLIACRLGAKSGVDLLRAYRESGGDGPVILLADQPDRAEDQAGLESGAAGYLVKNRLDPAIVERAIRYAVEAARRAAALRQARDELQARVAERTIALETMNAALTAEVAERRAAERALRETARGKDEFLATLAHELRSPLAPLSSAVEILSRTGDTPEAGPKRARAVDVIERQVEHMVRLIDDLLDLARVTHGKIALRRETVSLASVIEAALEASRPLLLGRGQAFELAVPERPLTLHVDPMRLSQLLSNLLSNAAKYSEPGGRVRLQVERKGEDVVIAVADSGIGIPAAQLAHVFTMFGQGHRAHAAVAGGLGIGLALAKRLAELHGGTLTAASEGEGKGSVFTLHLPHTATDSAAPPEREAPPRTPPHPRRILIVDDNVDAALTLAELLALEGHETHVAHDGPSAVDAARHLSPDVVVLDINLPGFDGLEVARRLRAQPDASRLLLVATSGSVQPDDRERSREAGFDHHLAKPVHLRSLEAVLAGADDAPGRTP